VATKIGFNHQDNFIDIPANNRRTKTYSSKNKLPDFSKTPKSFAKRRVRGVSAKSNVVTHSGSRGPNLLTILFLSILYLTERADALIKSTSFRPTLYPSFAPSFNPSQIPTSNTPTVNPSFGFLSCNPPPPVYINITLNPAEYFSKSDQVRLEAPDQLKQRNQALCSIGGRLSLKVDLFRKCQNGAIMQFWNVFIAPPKNVNMTQFQQNVTEIWQNKSLTNFPFSWWSAPCGLPVLANTCQTSSDQSVGIFQTIHTEQTSTIRQVNVSKSYAVNNQSCAVVD